jgi:drug/metabolite transporter (DMT)-like permease
LFLLGLFIGILAYVIFYLGKGIQKYAIDGFILSKLRRNKKIAIWIVGTILTAVYFFLEWIALFSVPINIIAPLGGVGLIVMLIFSYYGLHEKVYKIQIFGIIFIGIGISLLTAFNPNPGIISIDDINFPLLLVSTSSIITGEMIFIASKLKIYIPGFTIGVTAGTFNAFQTVCKRISSLSVPFISLIFTILTFIMAVLTLIFTMYAFTKARANVILPCEISADISFAVIISLIALNEKIILIQFIGLMIIILGVIFVTATRKVTKIEYKKQIKEKIFKYTEVKKSI